jgi:3-hydroxyacyl-CoA dehydrogenase
MRQDLHDGIATLILDAPPVNALNAALRRDLSAAFAACLADTDVRAIVLAADGRMFSAGADIREFGTAAAGPLLSDLCLEIEKAPKPVVAVLHGAALGGGAELALAAHYRIAVASATIGLPEVTLGLIPGAGGTQRLPRLVGAALALELMMTGRVVRADQAEEAGLIDGIVGEDRIAAARAFAQGLVARGMGPRPTAARRARMADGAGWLAAVEAARRAPGATAASGRIVDCVEAALLLPFAAGLTFERAAFDACLGDPRSIALRHLFLAERRLSSDLMSRDANGGRQLTAAGEELTTRLAQAQLAAAEALIRQGEDVAEIDTALNELGLGAADSAPFGTAMGALARRINAAVMAEGCRLISEGAVRDAGDVDVLAVVGLGYPRVTGGPMKSAEMAGLTDLRADMLHWAEDDPVWAVPPLLIQAVKFAGGFAAVTSG